MGRRAGQSPHPLPRPCRALSEVRGTREGPCVRLQQEVASCDCDQRAAPTCSHVPARGLPFGKAPHSAPSGPRSPEPWPWGCRRLSQRHSHPQGWRSQCAPCPAKGPEGGAQRAGVGGVVQAALASGEVEAGPGRWQRLTGTRGPGRLFPGCGNGDTDLRAAQSELPNWLLTSTGRGQWARGVLRERGEGG